MINTFERSKEFSQSFDDAPWWGAVYRRAFPGFVSMRSIRFEDNALLQRRGVDRIITTRGGREYTVDEKVRAKAWPDVLLERWSDVAKKVPGWINHGSASDLWCDFIAYAFVPTKRCLLFPFPILRRTWLDRGREWCALAKASRDGFRVVLADNGNYVTESIAVPESVLRAAIADTLEVRW